MITRKDILKKAVEECMIEFYKYAQPAGGYQEFKDILEHKYKDSREDPLYGRYYLSEENLKYIINMFCDAYNIKDHWNSNIELLLRNLREGGHNEEYIKDENHPYGYRTFKEVPSLKEIIPDFQKVIDIIENYKNFYKFDREESQFKCTILLGASPTSNKQAVIDYWKKKGVNIEINDFNIDDIYFNED